MNDRRAVIFDFDGTLADSAPIIRRIYTELAEKNRWRPLTDEDYEILRKGSLRQAKKWSGMRFWQFPMVIRNVKRLMELEAENVKLFPGMVEMIRELRQEEALDLYVLSRNSSGTIRRVLARYKLQNDLQILSRRRSLGSKTAVIRNLVRLKQYNKDNVWMVGDEVRDIQAAKRAGVKSVAVEWGIQDISILKGFKPDYTAGTVEQLKRVMQKV